MGSAIYSSSTCIKTDVKIPKNVTVEFQYLLTNNFNIYSMSTFPGSYFGFVMFFAEL